MTIHNTVLDETGDGLDCHQRGIFRSFCGYMRNGSIGAAALMLFAAPALATNTPQNHPKRMDNPTDQAVPTFIWSFTPAAAARLAGMVDSVAAVSGFRFTPSGGRRRMLVAVRARSATIITTAFRFSKAGAVAT